MNFSPFMFGQQFVISFVSMSVFLRNCRRNICDETETKILLTGATKARKDSVWQLNLLLPLTQGVWHMTSLFWSDVMQPSLVQAGLLDVIQISHSVTSWKDLCDTEDALRPPRMQMHIPLQSFLSLLPMPYAKQTSSCWCRSFSGCDKHKHTQH